MATKKCPVCGTAVKLENLEKHVRNQHPRATVDSGAVLTVAERREAKRIHAPTPPKVTSQGRTMIAVVAIVIAVIMLLIIWNPFRGGPGVGDVAPDFTLEACPSGPVTLSTYRGTVVLLELMDVDCGVCKNEAPTLRTLYQNFSPRGVVFLSVSLIDIVAPPDTCATVEDFKVTYSTDWTYAMDSDGEVRALYKVSGTPTTFILDRDGVIRARFDGRAPGGYDDYANALESAL